MSQEKTIIADCLQKFAKRKILVVGDMMLDEFLWGKVHRISPEAPVPIVEVQEEEHFPGGAANVARNLRAMGSKVVIAGRIGRDEAGKRLTGLLRADKIGTAGLIASDQLPTTVKTRIVARPQQVARVDREKKLPLAGKDLAKLLAALPALIEASDAVIIEDYAKGFVTQPVADAVGEACVRHQKFLAVDPNPGNPLMWPGASVIKPNRNEAFAAAGIVPSDDLRVVDQIGEILLRKWKVPMLLVTLGEQGMRLFRRGQHPHQCPSTAQEVFDVSGAGDTAIATFALAMASGATPELATILSNHASGIVVGKLGTATLTRRELAASFGLGGVD